MQSTRPKQAPLIPKTAFRSEPIWRLSELMKVHVIRAAVFTGVLDAILSYPKNKAPKRTMFVAIMLLLSQSHLEYKSQKVVLKHIWVVREEVTRQPPGMNSAAWDIIAGRVNDHVYRNGSWPSPYCAFDGQEYHKAFRRTTVWSHNRRQSNEEGVRLTQETVSHDVMLVYEESINRWWREYLKFLNYDSSIEFTKEKLPKDFYFCKLTWRISRYLYDYCGGSKNHPFLLNSGPLLSSIMMISSLLMYLSFSIMVRGCAFLSVIALLSHIITFPLFCFTRCLELETNHQMMWWATISFVQPANNLEEWDLVAKITNREWGNHHNRYLNNFFFDGKDCMKFFHKLYSSTTLAGNSWARLNRDIFPFLREAIDAASCNVKGGAFLGVKKARLRFLIYSG